MKHEETNTHFISAYETVNYGGGSMVDIIYLKSGGLLSINDEVVVYYGSVGDAHCDSGDLSKGSFKLPKDAWGDTPPLKGMTYIIDVGTWHTGGGVFLDFISLDNGWFIGLNDECVVLYRSEDQFYGEEDKDYEAIIHFPLDKPQETKEKIWSNQEINDLAEEALNIAVAHIQAKVGQTDGGLASIFFSGDEVQNMLSDYIKEEIINRDHK